MDEQRGESGRHGAGMSVREWMALLGITFAVFIFNTSEFIPIGLLSDIGSTFNQSDATTGLMITLYAWAVMVLSLPLMLLVSKVALKRLLLVVVAILGIGQALAIVVPTFGELVATRLVVACAHAVFWSIAAPVATLVVPASHKPLALSMVATGTSVAMILGMPLGRAIGLALGWRAAFLSVAIAAAVVLVYLALVLPALPVGDPFTLKQLPELFKNRRLLGIYLMVLFIVTGYYLGYSYIEPFLLKVAGLGNDQVTVVLTVFGVFGIVGSMLFSRVPEGGRKTFALGAILAMTAALALMLPAAASLVTVVVLVALWGMASTSFNVSLQNEQFSCIPQEASAVSMSIYSAIFNFGIGAGTSLGGMATNAVGLTNIGFVGAAIVAVAAVYCVVRYIPLARKG